MYLSKNSRHVIQKTWYSRHLVNHCFTQTSRNYLSKIPMEDPAKPPLRLNVPKDPPIDTLQQAYLTKGCIDCEKIKKSVEKPLAVEKSSQEHLDEINMLLNPPNIFLNEDIDKDAVRKAMSMETVRKSRNSPQNFSSVSKIPKKIRSHDDIKTRKKIYESNIPKLKNKPFNEQKIVKRVHNIQAKPVYSIKETKRIGSDLFLELRKNQKDVKLEKRKIKTAENTSREKVSKKLASEESEVKNEGNSVRRTKGQENFDAKNNSDINPVGEKETRPIVKFSQLDNKNMALPMKTDYLEAAIENVIPKTKTVEVKMKFRVRIDRIGKEETEQLEGDDIGNAELAYEVISDNTKPKTPKTMKTEKVVKDVMKTIVHKARDAFEDKRLNKSLKKEQKVLKVKIHEPDESWEAASRFTEDSNNFKKPPFEVTELDDAKKISSFKRFPYPKTRLEKTVSYHGKVIEDVKTPRQYLLSDQFHLPTGNRNDSILNLPRTPKSRQRILKPLGSQITMIDDVPEYLKYPEFKYVGLSSTASRNFHNTTVENKFKDNAPLKHPVMPMDNIIKSRGNLGSLKNVTDTIVNRAVNPLGKDIKKPIHMSVQAAMVKKVDDECKKSGRKHRLRNSRTNLLSPPRKFTHEPLNKKSKFEREKMFGLEENQKSKVISPKNDSKGCTSEVLFNNPKTVPAANENKFGEAKIPGLEEKKSKETIPSSDNKEEPEYLLNNPKAVTETFASKFEEKASDLEVNKDSKVASPNNDSKGFSPEVLFNNSKITSESDVIGTSSGLIRRESKIEEGKLKNKSKSKTVVQKSQKEPCCEEDFTNYLKENDKIRKESKMEKETLKNKSAPKAFVQKNKKEPCCEEDFTNFLGENDKPKKPIRKEPYWFKGETYGYRDTTQYKKNDEVKTVYKTRPISNNRTETNCRSETEFELNLQCVDKPVGKWETPGKCLKMSPFTKRRQRFPAHKTKPTMINVQKPPSIPKISDNFVNMANESLTKPKENPSVDSLRMMQKVKTILDFDLKNAEKIFTPQERIIPSAVRLVKEPWNWAVDNEDLKKWELRKTPRNVTSKESLVCLNEDCKWKVINLPERNQTETKGDGNRLAAPSDSRSKSSGTDQKCLKNAKTSRTKRQNLKNPEYDPKKESYKTAFRKVLNCKSVIAFNPDVDNFQIINAELKECRKYSKVDLDPVTYDSSAFKFLEKSKGVSAILYRGDNKLDLDKEALQSVEGKDPSKVEEKSKGSSVLIFDEKSQSWVVDLFKNDIPSTLTLENQKRIEENNSLIKDSNTSQPEVPPTPEPLLIGRKDNLKENNFTDGNKQTDTSKKEHYVSDNILEMTKHHPSVKQPKVKSNIGKTVKVDISSAEHSPSKITEINLNKEVEKSKSEKSVDVPDEAKQSESKPFHKDFEKYQTPYGEPDYEDKPLKINTDIKSNPNMKKLNGSNKTLVLQDTSKPNDALDHWLKNETDKMADLLIKVLQEASEAKLKRKVLNNKINSKYLKNKKENSAKKETGANNPEEQRLCKIPDRRNTGAPRPTNVNEIPVQSAKNVQPPKTVDAADVNNISAFNEVYKEDSSKINREIFEIPQEIIDPIGINVDNLPELNLKKIPVSEHSLVKMKSEQAKRKLMIPEIPVKSVISSPLKESISAEKEEQGIDVPGPEGLKKWSLVWKYLPAVGCQATVWIFQLAQIGASIFSTYNSSKVHSRVFDNLFSKYGPIVKLSGPLGGEVLLINRPEHIKAIFDQEGKYSIRSIFDSVDRCRLLSLSKSTSFMGFEDWKGRDWEELRKTLIDSTLNVEKYFDYFQEAGKLLVQRISSTRKNRMHVPEDFMDDIKRYSLECLCYVVFDKSFGFLNFNSLDWSAESNRLMKLLSDATDCILKCETGFQMWRFVDTPSSVVLNNACQSLESFIGKHVRIAEMNLSKKKAELTSGKIRVSDLNLIEHMFLIDGMAYDEVVYTVLDMLLIGVNTASCALGFLLYRLAQNTRVQRMLFKEIRNVLPSKSSELNYHRLHSLKYLQACLKESLRLNAPIPLLIRNLNYDASLPEFRIPKGTFVVMDAQAQCMREHNFEDPEKYFPERWLDPNHMDMATIPFCHGSKADIGKLLSEIQIWSFVAQLLRNFKIEYNYGDIRGTDEAISFPDKPLKLSFIDRKEEE